MAPHDNGPDADGTARRRFLLRAAVPVAMMLAIAALSLRPLPVGLAGGSDKLAHIAVWSGLAGAWSWSIGALGGPALRTATLAAGLAAAWGGGDELLQSSVPWRDASAGDFAADLGGSVAGALGWLWYRRSRPAGADRGRPPERGGG